MQAFLIIGFVLALILDIGFYIEKEKEKNLKMAAENKLIFTVGSSKKLQADLNKRIENALSQIIQKENELDYLALRLDKEKKIRAMLSENLKRSNTRLAMLASKKDTVDLEKIVVTSLLEAEGRVLAVDKQNDLIVVNFGLVNNVKNGDRISVYKGNDFIANAELVKVQNEISAALILPESRKNVDVEINDLVKLL